MRTILAITLVLANLGVAHAESCAAPAVTYGLTDREREQSVLAPEMQTGTADIPNEVAASECQPGQETDSLCFNYQRFEADCRDMPDQKVLSCHGTVYGLDVNGDNFLAVRTGPGSQHKLVGKLTTGTTVMIWERLGNWLSISVERLGQDEASGWKTASQCEVYVNGKIWVHKKWVQVTGVWSP